MIIQVSYVMRYATVVIVTAGRAMNLLLLPFPEIIESCHVTQYLFSCCCCCYTIGVKPFRKSSTGSTTARSNSPTKGSSITLHAHLLNDGSSMQSTTHMSKL